ncbi:MAG: oxygen-independent coproporphyrinogen III oxidase [Clostridiales bacterium]|nr:oxygen-independent coproporphyrinogen III oxidase [Clostridiales bacterium]
MDKECSLYIHVPFCKAKCYYCDFASFDNCDCYIKDYIESVVQEIALVSPKNVIKTIFIGGGTPSYINESYIYKVLDKVYSCCSVKNDAEITIESNPGTLNRDKLLTYKSIGINRLSMGVQSTNDNVLKKLGRIHTYKDFIDNFNLAREVGFRNISVDLMFGVPGQDENIWRQTLGDVVKISPEHVSAYSLTIEEGTKFGDMYQKGEISYVQDDIDRSMYHYAIDFLGQHGYHQYEISNFAKRYCECEHNKVYWNDECYIGIGLGAHSYFAGKRYNNTYDMNQYIKSVKRGIGPHENIEAISKTRDMSDYMILGLRLASGVSKKKFYERFNESLDLVYLVKIEDLKARGLIKCDADKVVLTKLGLDLANKVFVEFI